MACEAFYTYGPAPTYADVLLGLGVSFIPFGTLANTFQYYAENAIFTCADLVAALPNYTTGTGGVVDSGTVILAPDNTVFGFTDLVDGAYTVTVTVDGVGQGFFTVSQTGGVVTVDLTNCTVAWPLALNDAPYPAGGLQMLVTAGSTNWAIDYGMFDRAIIFQDDWVACAVPFCAVGFTYCIIEPPLAIANYTFTSTPGAVIK